MDKIHNPDLHDITIKHNNTGDKIITSILSKIALIYCLALEKVADILDFTYNAKSKVVVHHTTVSDINENLMVGTEISNLLRLCKKWH